MDKLNLQEIADRCGYNNVYNEAKKQEILLNSLQNNLIDSLINRYITKSLLSHWKSAVESIVLETRQYKFKNFCRETSYTNPKVIKIMNVALYKIFIKEKKLFEYGYTLKDKYNWVDVIVINEEMSIKEKRCVVAHELAHIIIDRILKENIDIIPNMDFDNLNEEELANILMCYILLDKSFFYKNAQFEDYVITDVLDLKELRNSILKKYRK